MITARINAIEWSKNNESCILICGDDKIRIENKNKKFLDDNYIYIGVYIDIKETKNGYEFIDIHEHNTTKEYKHFMEHVPISRAKNGIFYPEIKINSSTSVAIGYPIRILNNVLKSSQKQPAVFCPTITGFFQITLDSDRTHYYTLTFNKTDCELIEYKSGTAQVLNSVKYNYTHLLRYIDEYSRLHNIDAK